MLSYTTYLNHSTLPWVTFIDGAGGIFSIWKKQLPEFQRHYNVLVVELKEEYSPFHTVEDLNIDRISNGILHVLETENIVKSHFIGLSLGTVFIRNFALRYPGYVESMVLAGAIIKINYRLRFLFWVQKLGEKILSFSSQFNFFLYSLLPNRNHKESRSFLMERARKWDNEEFLKWCRFTKKLNPILNYLYSEKSDIPCLYIMGEEDKLFLSSVRKISSSKSGSLLFIIQDCGHIVNLEQEELFNKMVIGYIVGIEGVSEVVRPDLEDFSNCSPEEVLIANSNNHSKK
ncbi:alpha/beta fold hydrolase [Maribacter cobaltidurans]|uniref:AB hydrolase-1 domain-containing protein n=1 Tax=Maribacter cobaltidurans TaxID=1178778 RepID=A0A223V2C8_9FLAO|nr:alpha/beta hydrolase [Maribacter cobaltidurans]ASV29158.1 hypothetical protein CJ263_02355 [Maribacter cobaltidurans]